MKKRRCYLCGGKLVNGRCTLCGLDNTKIERKNYRLNESSFDRKGIEAKHLCESHNGKPSGSHTNQSGGQNRQRQNGQNQQRQVPWQNGQNQQGQTSRQRGQNWTQTGGKKKTAGKQKKGWISTVIVLLMILISVGGPAISFVTTEIKNKIDQINNSGDDNWWSGSEIDTSVDENDPYEFVTRELSDSGEVYDTELGYGEYVVGTDIPEGTYEVTLQSGYGSFQTDDPDNSIYLYGYFSENASDEDEDITEMEDVRLYEGAHVMIGEDVVLAFHTENGQTGQMQSEDNPLSVTYTLQPEKKYTVGKEIPAGVYDVSGTKDWAVMEYEIYLGELYDEEYDSLNYQNYSIMVEAGNENAIYKNAVLTEGTEITVTGKMILTPSKKIGSQDYEAFYDIYRK
ncbi:MAG: hypothetical protein ACLR8Q_10995 [[Ruminococcus] lactaris]|uniref:hypothetical protein n=1 Tax=[Ruminococcus] lactaris TaxID=46228 RepID=UPI00399F63B6